MNDSTNMKLTYFPTRSELMENGDLRAEVLACDAKPREKKGG